MHVAKGLWNYEVYNRLIYPLISYSHEGGKAHTENMPFYWGKHIGVNFATSYSPRLFRRLLEDSWEKLAGRRHRHRHRHRHSTGLPASYVDKEDARVVDGSRTTILSSLKPEFRGESHVSRSTATQWQSRRLHIVPMHTATLYKSDSEYWTSVQTKSIQRNPLSN